MSENDKTCSRCRKTMLMEYFELNIKEEYYKTCKKCRKRMLCEHGRQKSSCKECGGSSICVHGRQKSSCKECGGSSICEHGRHKYLCKECGGSGICEHGRRKSRCKECGGSSICEHGKQKSRCKECGGSSICEHGRHKSSCKECGGSSICEHGKQKSRCKECGGSSICEHGRHKSSCKECGGSSICVHGRQKYICKECGGSGICEHGKRKSQCITCTPKNACQNCLHIYVNRRYRFKPYCFRCYCMLNPDVEIPRRYKLKEHHTQEVLKSNFPGVKLIFDKRIDNACSLRRPDVRIECLTHTVIIECDEDQHKRTSCEDKRTMEIFQDLGSRPLVMIRFNPDKYDKTGGCFKITKAGSLSLNKKEWFRRTSILCDNIQKYLDIVPEKEVTVEYLFYG
jgi:hypothetical protein